MADRETLHLVVVGHADHGKSTLIGRLLWDTGSLSLEKMQEVQTASRELGRDIELAYVMDHFAEERAEAMTIDTAQAFLKTSKRDYVIADTPGHKGFVRNMITGASQAEAAVLVVDAAEGVREQTRRHMVLVSMLGIDQAVVLVNKIDEVGFKEDRFREVAGQAAELLESLAEADRGERVPAEEVLRALRNLV